MHARIIRRLSAMLHETDIKSSCAHENHKRYTDPSIIHTPFFKEAKRLLIQNPPNEAKTAQKRRTPM